MLDNFTDSNGRWLTFYTMMTKWRSRWMIHAQFFFDLVRVGLSRPQETLALTCNLRKSFISGSICSVIWVSFSEPALSTLFMVWFSVRLIFDCDVTLVYIQWYERMLTKKLCRNRPPFKVMPHYDCSWMIYVTL